MIYQNQNSIGKYFLEMVRYKNFNFKEHFHRHYEVVYVREGELIVGFSSKQEIIKAGECAFISSNILHSYKTETYSVADVCIFSGDFVPFFSNEVRQKNPHTCKFICRKAVLEFALSELFVENALPDIYTAKSVLYGICGEILNNIQFSKPTDKQDILINHLLEYVSLNFQENISLASAAEKLGYEKHYLSRCYHSTIPIHFSKYVNHLRVDAATELLQHSDLSITDIAFSCGFQSIRTFNRTFLEIVGDTPKKYYNKIHSGTKSH